MRIPLDSPLPLPDYNLDPPGYDCDCGDCEECAARDYEPDCYDYDYRPTEADNAWADGQAADMAYGRY